MKVRFYFCVISFFALVNTGNSQSTFVPKNLGSEINSPYDEVSPVISPDGKTLYFTRLNHPENTGGIKNSADVWVSELKKDGTVVSTQRLAAFNTGKYNSVLSLSADGNQLLLYTDKNLFTSSRNNQTWAAPQKLAVKAGKDAAMSGDGKVIVFSKGGNLYVIEKSEEGTWGKAIALKALNTNKETTPFLVADNKTLYFTSDRKGKQLDIYKAIRSGTDWNNWSVPEILNDTINSAQEESYLKTNANGSWAYYSSTNNSLGKSDIFRVKLYEDNPFVEVTGTVVNAISKRPLRHLPVTLLANGAPADSVTFNSDSATFRVKLPMGKSHVLAARVDHYTSFPVTIDAKKIKEYTRMQSNLEEGPTSYVLLKGKLLIKNTGMPIPEKAKPTIVVDGEVIDSANVDPGASTYSLKLNHGAVYYVQVSAKQFESLPAFVDFTSVDGYEEINLDLQADAEKMAIITGKLIDKKSNKPFTYPAVAKIEVEGVSSVSAVVDSLTGSYELRLPLRLSYTISAHVQGYYPISEIIDVSKESNEVMKELDLAAVPVEKGKTVPMKNVFFDAGKTTLTDYSLPALNKLAEFLVSHPRTKIEVGTYTATSNKVSTLALAKTITKYLTSKGVSASQVFAKGYGTAKGARAKDESIPATHAEFLFLSGN